MTGRIAALVASVPMVCPICQEVGPPCVRCTVCGRDKHLLGRDMGDMAQGLCTSKWPGEPFGCEGYDQEPYASELWPGSRYMDSLGHMDWHLSRRPERPARKGDKVQVPCANLLSVECGDECEMCEGFGTVWLVLTRDPLPTGGFGSWVLEGEVAER